MKTIIKVEQIGKAYQTANHARPALQDASFDVAAGEFVTITGPSGSGKSTLLNLLGCLDDPTTGRYFIDGSEVSNLGAAELADIRNRKIGFVFQSFNLLPRLSARENAELPLIYSKARKKERRARAETALDRVGLRGLADRRPNQLSGGEQQRVAIARALINDPSLILADEPTGALDTKTGSEIAQHLLELNSAGITVILVTHDENMANIGNRRIRLRDGRVESDEPIEIRKSAIVSLPEREPKSAGKC